MRFLLYGLAAYGLYLIIYLLIIAVQIWSWIIKPIRFETTTPFPDDLIRLFDAPIHDLAQLNFEIVLRFVTYNILGFKTWSVLLQNPTWRTFAIIDLQPFLHPNTPFSMAFYTFLENGSLLLTLNGLQHTIVGTMPQTILQDAYAANLADQWRLHRRKLDELGPSTAQSLNGPTFLKQLDNHHTAYINQMLATNQFVPDKVKQQFYLSPLAALKSALKRMIGNRKVKAQHAQIAKQSAQQEITPLDLPLSFEVETFYSYDNRKRRRVSSQTKVTVTLITLVLFALSAWLLFDWWTILIVIVVLAFHELGHFTAMRLVGYQNLSFFFLPFFGAAVTGHKQHAILAERMFVLFAGPLPGYLLGMGLIFLLIIGRLSEAWYSWAIWLLMLNYLNLLPLYPLDGGRILDQLLFIRQASAGVWFKGVAAAIFLLGGFWFSDVILFTLAFLLGITLPGHFRSARLMKNLKAHLPMTNEEDEVTAIFRSMKQADIIAVPFNIKYQLVKAAQFYQQTPNDELLTRLAFILLYVSCLGSGLLLWLWLTSYS